LFTGPANDKLTIAEYSKTGTVIHRPNLEKIEQLIKENDIDVLVIDPLISAHEVSENDQTAMDMIVKQALAPIARQRNCSIDVSHHTRKTGNEAVTFEDSRGASALGDAIRCGDTLNHMTEGEFEKANPGGHRRQYFRVNPGKENYSISPDKAVWYKIESVNLNNNPAFEGIGDSVGVVTSWKWPDLSVEPTGEQLARIQDALLGKTFREHYAAKEWIGNTIAPIIDLDGKRDRSTITKLITDWTTRGALTQVEMIDRHQHSKLGLQLGDWSKAPKPVH
jgi:hypothetical protein